MPVTKPSMTELEIRVDDRGKHTLWFKGERVPGVLSIDTHHENGQRAQISVTFTGAAVALVTEIPSGVYWDESRKILCDAAGVVTGHNAMPGWLRRKDEFPAYVKPIPGEIFYVPEMGNFFTTGAFELMDRQFHHEWRPRAAEFPQKHLTDAITESFPAAPYYYDYRADQLRNLDGTPSGVCSGPHWDSRKSFSDYYKKGPIPPNVYYYDGVFYTKNGMSFANQEWLQADYHDRRTEFPVLDAKLAVDLVNHTLTIRS